MIHRLPLVNQLGLVELPLQRLAVQVVVLFAVVVPHGIQSPRALLWAIGREAPQFSAVRPSWGDEVAPVVIPGLTSVELVDAPALAVSVGEPDVADSGAEGHAGKYAGARQRRREPI